jgi:alkylated DNA repair protein (DNA oxidative demethylase)
MTNDLFGAQVLIGQRDAIGEQAIVLRGFCAPSASDLMRAIEHIAGGSPFRHMTTPGGFIMSAAMTNSGALGWTSDRRGYRYVAIDPTTNRPWPAMPKEFLALAASAAAAAGFKGFVPDACLINRYSPGARLTLHQDKNENDFSAPIVSVSLGIPAMFLFGGSARSDKAARIPLLHGDVAVWGGVDRLRYHGVLPIKADRHPLLGAQRINLTFRKAG